MKKDHDFGGVVDHQFLTLEHIDLFTGPQPKRAEELSRLADPCDQWARSDLRAKGTNCQIAAGGNAAVNENGDDLRHQGSAA